MRLAQSTSSTLPSTTFSTNTFSPNPTRRTSTSYTYNDQKHDSPFYRISLQWTLHTRTYTCPPLCSISLYSLIYIRFDDLPISSSGFFIDSCDLIALYPYSNYFQTRRLISQG